MTDHYIVMEKVDNSILYSIDFNTEYEIIIG